MHRILPRTTPATLSFRELALRLLPLWCALLMLAFTPYDALWRDLWTDEAFTASYTFHPDLATLLNDVRKNEETPPLYFLIMWKWAQLFDHSEAALRGLSLLGGVLAVLAFTRLAQRRLAPEQAALAGIVMALAPLLQSYLVEARGYTLTLLMAVLCTLAFEQLYERPDSRAALALYGLSAAALFLTSYFGIVLLAAHNLIWLHLLLRERAAWRGRLVAWCLVQIGIALCVWPWLPSLLYQLEVAPAATSNWSNGLRDYYYLALSVVMGNPARGVHFILWLLLAALGWGMMVVALLDQRKRGEGLLLRTFAVPALALVALVIVMQVVAPRYLITLLPGAALGIGASIGALRRRSQRLAVALMLLLIGGIALYRVTGVPISTGHPWPDLLSRVERQAERTGDVVLFHPPWDQRIFEYYYRGPELPLLGAHDYDEFYYVQNHDLRRTWTVAEAQPATQGYRRVWVFYNQMFHTVPQLALPYVEKGHWRAGRLELFLYEVPEGS